MNDTLAQGQEKNSPMTEVTIEVKDLPSRGLGYPTKELKFYYRGYTYGEIKKVSTTNDIDLPQLVDIVMSGIRAEGDFNKFNMSFVDMLYIGLLRRVSSQGHLKYQIPYHCEECGQQSQAVFGSQDLDFQDIRPEVKSLPIEVEISGHKMRFSYPTVQNMLDVKSYSKEKKKRKTNPALEIQARQVVNMDFDVVYEILENLGDDDEVELLTEIDKMLFHDIRPIKSVCKKTVEDEETGKAKVCGHVNLIDIEGKELLIKPFRSGEGLDRSKIRFVGEQDS